VRSGIERSVGTAADGSYEEDQTACTPSNAERGQRCSGSGPSRGPPTNGPRSSTTAVTLLPPLMKVTFEPHGSVRFATPL